MKRLFAIGLFSMLLAPHFCDAADHVDADQTTAAVKHHRHKREGEHADKQAGSHKATHAHRHSKADDTTPVDINHADAKALATLKGIGAKKAAAIVAYRTAHGSFQSINDLSHVKGIGDKALVRLQNKNPGRLVINTDAKIG